MPRAQLTIPKPGGSSGVNSSGRMRPLKKKPGYDILLLNARARQEQALQRRAQAAQGTTPNSPGTYRPPSVGATPGPNSPGTTTTTSSGGSSPNSPRLRRRKRFRRYTYSR